MVKPKKTQYGISFSFHIRNFSRYFIFNFHNFKFWDRYGQNVAKRLKDDSRFKNFIGIVVCNLSPKPLSGNSRRECTKNIVRFRHVLLFIVYMFDNVSFFLS